MRQTSLAKIALNRDPFTVLISCLISLRTKDAVTLQASQRLFELAKTPKGMSLLAVRQIEKAIYPAGFYRTKARTIRDIGTRLVKEFRSKVPDTLEGLLSLKGVGRKTANIVLTMGFHKPGIAVDVHVHRISNRLGYVRTATPDETEVALRRNLPRRHWIEYNDLLVTFGQNICLPVSPLCSLCALQTYCPKVGVGKRR